MFQHNTQEGSNVAVLSIFGENTALERINRLTNSVNFTNLLFGILGVSYKKVTIESKFQFLPFGIAMT